MPFGWFACAVFDLAVSFGPALLVLCRRATVCGRGIGTPHDKNMVMFLRSAAQKFIIILLAESAQQAHECLRRRNTGGPVLVCWAFERPLVSL